MAFGANVAEVVALGILDHAEVADAVGGIGQQPVARLGWIVVVTVGDDAVGKVRVGDEVDSAVDAAAGFLAGEHGRPGGEAGGEGSEAAEAGDLGLHDVGRENEWTSRGETGKRETGEQSERLKGNRNVGKLRVWGWTCFCLSLCLSSAKTRLRMASTSEPGVSREYSMLERLR